LEKVDKSTINKALENATVKSRKGKYHKGNHSFKLLASTNPTLLQQASIWAKRFFEEVANQG
jgi:hypothetical protein